MGEGTKRFVAHGKRVYIAYRYNNVDAGKVLANIGVAHKVAFHLVQQGYIPFIPHADCLFAIMFGKKVPLQFYYNNSMEWLCVCEYICIVDDGEPLSNGVLMELGKARELGLKEIRVQVNSDGEVIA